MHGIIDARHLTSEVKKAVHVMGCMLDPAKSLLLLLNCQVDKQQHEGFGFAVSTTYGLYEDSL